MLDLSSLQKIVSLASEGTRSPFYRRHWKLDDGSPQPKITSLSDFQNLPFLTKDDMIACPLEDRSFLPLSELDHLRTSSGTSGKPPLFSPRTHVRGMEYRLDLHDFKTPFMAFTVPMMPHWHERFQAEFGVKIPVVVFDPKYPQASLRLARIAEVDAFSSFVYHMPLIGEAAKREGINERIRYIEITGETCSREMYRYMRATFPNATIAQSYGASEVEDVHIGMPCKAMDGSEPLALYHPKSTHYLEIQDTHTGKILEPKSGVEGDLIITAYPGEPSALPLIRFKIGDTIRVVDEHCPHGEWSFTVLGRSELDFLKVPGGILRADEIERVLRLFPESVTDRFEMRVRSSHTPAGPKLSPHLRLELRDAPDLSVLARSIEKELRVAPSFTWAQGVTEGRYLPIVCEPLSIEGGQKQRKIIQD